MAGMMMRGVAPRFPTPIPPADSKPLVGCYVSGGNGAAALAAAQAFDRFLGVTTGLSLCFAAQDFWANGGTNAAPLGGIGNYAIFFQVQGDYGRQNQIAKLKRIMCSLPGNVSGGTSLKDVREALRRYIAGEPNPYVYPNNTGAVTQISPGKIFYDYGVAAVACGAIDCLWRIMWEANVSGFYHSVRTTGFGAVNLAPYIALGQDTATAQASAKLDYIAVFQYMVTILRSVPGNKFQFVWGPLKGDNGCGDPLTYYPGDAYVDFLGPDVYNNYYQSFVHADGHFDLALRFDKYTLGKSSYTGVTTGNAAGNDYCLRWYMEMAVARQKQIILSEWGTGFAGALRGAWAAGTYNPWDYVTYNGHYYWLNSTATSTAVPGNAPWVDMGVNLGSADHTGGDDATFISSIANLINTSAPLANGKPLFYSATYWNADNGMMRVDSSGYFTGTPPADIRNEKPLATAAFLAGFGR